MKYTTWQPFKTDESQWSGKEAVLTFKTTSNESVKKNHKVKLHGICGSGRTSLEYTSHEHGGTWTAGHDELESVEVLSKTTKKQMSLISKYNNLTRKEPQKTLVKVGVLDEDLQFTSEGQELFLAYLLTKHADDFKKEVVDVIVAEDTEKKK